MGREAKSVQKEVICSIPQSIINDLRNLLNAVSEKPLTDIQYYGHLRILRVISIKHEASAEGWVSIDSQVLKGIIGGNSARWLKNLCKIGLIEFRKSSSGMKMYSSASHIAMQYRYTDTFRHEEFVPITAYRRVFKNRPVKKISDKVTKRLLADVDGFPEYGFLFRNLHSITIDMEAVRAECRNWLVKGACIKGVAFNESLCSDYIRRCEALNDDEVSFNIGRGNRIWTKVLGVPSALIRFLRVKDYNGTLYQGDLTSAHILLAVPLIREFQTTIATTEGREELTGVIEMIGSKTFYQTISSQLRAEGVEIPETNTAEKKMFLSKVWNSRDDKYTNTTPYRKVFTRLYPAFNSFVLAQKADGVPAFWDRITRMEAELFNNNMVKAVMNELGPDTFLAGKYDALIYKEEDKEAIEAIMEDFIRQYSGIRGMVKSAALQQESEKKVVYPEQQQEVEREVLPPVMEHSAPESQTAQVTKATEAWQTQPGSQEATINPMLEWTREDAIRRLTLSGALQKAPTRFHTMLVNLDKEDWEFQRKVWWSMYKQYYPLMHGETAA